eukprot:5000442-Prymnesium_polylepis.1
MGRPHAAPTAPSAAAAGAPPLGAPRRVGTDAHGRVARAHPRAAAGRRRRAADDRPRASHRPGAADARAPARRRRFLRGAPRRRAARPLEPQLA